MKINITMNDELLAKVDKFAAEQYTSRSGLISQAVVQYLNQQEAMNLIRLMSKAMKRIADNGEIDDEAKQQLADFERICQMLSMQ